MISYSPPDFQRFALAEMLERTPEPRDPDEPSMQPNHALAVAILRAPGDLNCDALAAALCMTEFDHGARLVAELWDMWFITWKEVDDPFLWLRVAAALSSSPAGAVRGGA